MRVFEPDEMGTLDAEISINAVIGTSVGTAGMC